MDKSLAIQAQNDRAKGQKLVGALYLVTEHLAESDPLRQRVRALALALLQTPERVKAGEELLTLLGAAVLARTISERNVSLITYELQLYLHTPDQDSQTLSSLFERHHDVKSARSQPAKSHTSIHQELTSNTVQYKTNTNSDTKNKRQDQILSFINDRKSAAIKDIATLFPEVSEKTIQRELGTLVALGKINKRGSKRWSLYMAI